MLRSKKPHPIQELKQAARKAIVEHDIDQDQTAIIDRWAKTFIYSTPEDKTNEEAINMVMLSMAVVAKGDFYINIGGANATFIPPSDVLFIADYFSHASRVMIDMIDLSSDNRDFFLTKFAKEKLNPRGSTHFTRRKNGELIERKGLKHGAIETFKTVVHAIGEKTRIGPMARKVGIQGPDVTDFGIDIMMGGMHQENLSGGISSAGRDGHLLIYMGESDSIMVGLEQTKPPLSAHDVSHAIDAVFSTGSTSAVSDASSHADADVDNTSGLSDHHSMIGHSDSYTAAGSLYFSNLIYKIKLLEQKNTLTPAKYNGMRVKLNDDNICDVMGFYTSLLTAKRDKNFDEMKALLQQLPKTHVSDVSAVDNNYLFLLESIQAEHDLREFFKQIYAVYGEGFGYDVLFEQKLTDIQRWLVARQLPENNRRLVKFGDEINSLNPHIQRLKNTFNQVIEILEKKSKNELASWLHHPAVEFVDFLSLADACSKIVDPNDDALSLSDSYINVPIGSNEGGVCKKIKEQKARWDSIYAGVKICLDSQDVSNGEKYFTFDYLVQIEALGLSIQEALNTNESKLILMLYKDNIKISEENRSLLIEQERYPKFTSVDNVIQPIADASTSDHCNGVFLLRCMSSLGAFNADGRVIILATLIIVGTIIIEGHPALMLGVSIAVAGLLTGTACFFKANSGIQRYENQESLTPSPQGAKVSDSDG